MDEIIAAIETNLAKLRKLNDQKAPTRCRELSVAITEIETGLLWLRAAKDNEIPF